MELGLKSKQILVIGGSGGIGSALVKSFIAEGAKVQIISRNRPENLSPEVVWYGCDITIKSEFEKTAGEILKSVAGSLDVLVCNVGSGSGSNQPVPDEDEWENLWNINFSGALQSLRLFHNALKTAKGSAILVSSIAGVEKIGAPTAYSVAKSALITLSKELSHKWAPEIRINAIAPGNVLAEGGVWDRKTKENPEAINKLIETGVPLRRFGKPQEIADLVLFLSSERATFITGACFVIDGGQTTAFH